MTPSPPPRAHIKLIKLIHFQQGLSMTDSCSAMAPKPRPAMLCTRRDGHRAFAAWPTVTAGVRGFRLGRQDVLPVLRLAASYDASQRHDPLETSVGCLRGDQAAAAHLATGDQPANRNQDDQRKSPRDKAAWRIKHKVIKAMVVREAQRQMSGFVQVDYAYLGGERNGGKPGRGSENKQTFLIAVQADAVIEPVSSSDDASIKRWQARYLATDAEVFSDGLFCFRRFARAHGAGDRRRPRRLRGANRMLVRRAAVTSSARSAADTRRSGWASTTAGGLFSECAPQPSGSGVLLQTPL